MCLRIKYFATVTCLIMISLFNNGFAQISIKNPFEDHVFTKNEGQWRNEEKEINRNIYFGAYLQGKHVFITNKGLVYKYLEYHNEEKGIFEKWFEKRRKPSIKKEEDEEEEYYKKGKYIPNYVFINYDGCQVNSEINAEGKSKSYTCYSASNNLNNTIKAFGYQKIILTDIYPHINVEFTIHQTGGFEYRFILKPNATVSDIKISYKGLDHLSINAANQLVCDINSNNKLIESKPIAFEKTSNKQITCSRFLNKEVQTFTLANYNKNQEIIIDPIVFDPTLTSYNKAYDIARDNNGNVIVYGGLCPYVLKKFDNTGALLWSFDWSTQPSPPTLYGDFVVDQTGNIIMIQGYPSGRIIKTDPNGTIIFNTILPGTTTATEFWRIAYNCDYSTLRLSGFVDVSGVYKQIVNVDPSNGNLVASAPLATDESRALFVAPNGDIYSLTPTQGLSSNPATNYFTKFDASLNSLYRVTSGYNNNEGSGIYQNVTYNGGSNAYANMNAITADLNNVYTYDGNTVYKRRESNGSYVGSVVIPNAITLGNSGIVIDPCHNIFVGTQSGVVQLDTNLSIINTLATPSQVYDICLYNDHILATGNGFVNELNFNTGCQLSAITTTIANTNCQTPFNGSASVSTPTNGTAPYTYLWNTGATSQTISALAPGKYWVKVKDAYCGNPKMKVDTVFIVDNITMPVASFTANSACIGSTTNFTNSSTPTSGSFSITNYLWDFDNDGTIDDLTQNPSYTYLTSGNHIVNLSVANAGNGCTTSLTQTVTVNSLPPIYAINTNSQCDTTKIDWINFSSVNSSLATGSSVGYSVSVTQSNGGLFPHAGMYGVGNFPSQYSVTNITNAIANNQAGLFTFCFNEPVINPQISLSSIGNPSTPVPVNTSEPYEVVWNGLNMQYPSNTQFIGQEGYTIVKFPGIHTCISFDYLVTESYCTVGFGLLDVKCQKDTVCANEQVAFLARGASTYTWNTGATTNTLTTNPTVSSQYTVIGTDNNGCKNSAILSIEVYTFVPVTVNSASICIGQQTATLTANNSITYTWFDPSTLSSSTGSIVTATPAISTDYTITATDINQCVQTVTTSVFVYSLPTISVSSNTLCIGNAGPISASGAQTYTWASATTLSGATGASVIASPTISTNYTVTATDINGCINSNTTTVIVNPLPIITITSNTICIGKSGDLIASGASSYTWNSSSTLNSTTGATVTASPIVTTNYTVTATYLNGCVNTNTTTLTVNNSPNVSVTPSFSTCSTFTNNLTATGADTYTWLPSSTLSSSTGSVVVANPLTTQTYFVIGENTITTCTNTALVTISVTPTPTVIAIASPTIICPQQSSTLTASGASNYLWLPFNTLGNSVIASPTVNTTYTVIGANGTCTNSVEVAVTVTVNPTITVTTETICSGNSANLTANGAVTYTWNPSTYLNTNQGSNVTSTTSSTFIYSVIGSSALGCKSSETLQVTVVKTPTVSIVANPLTICTGSSSVLTASGATSYTWIPAATVSNATSPSTAASPLSTTIYTAIGENNLGSLSCTSTQTMLIKVLPKIIPVLSPNSEICEGQSTKIFAQGGNIYHWFPTLNVSKPNDSVTVVKPTSTTIYTVFVSYNSMCPESATLQVTVNPLPIIDAGKDSTINIDESIVLQGTGNVQVGFLSPNDEPLVCNWCSVVEVSPKETTCYVLEGYSDRGCRSKDEVCITITKFWDVYVPDAFTPNTDAINDYFLPVGYGITQIDLSIFDRWGAKIFNEANTQLGWDGTFKGVPSPQGVYTYQLIITSMNGEVTSKTGHVTLLYKLK